MEGALTAVAAEPFTGGRTIGDWGYGPAMAMGAGWGAVPVAAGFDLMFAKWGTSTGPLEIGMDDARLLLQQKRADQAVFMDAWVRIQPPYWWIRPYLEGIAGAKLLSAKYSLAFVGGSDETSAFTEKTAAHTIGWGAGVDILLAKATDHSNSALFATLGFRRLSGGNASFNRAVNDHSPNQLVSFYLPTDTTIVTLGVAFRAHLQATR